MISRLPIRLIISSASHSLTRALNLNSQVRLIMARLTLTRDIRTNDLQWIFRVSQTIRFKKIQSICRSFFATACDSFTNSNIQFY